LRKNACEAALLSRLKFERDLMCEQQLCYGIADQLHLQQGQRLRGARNALSKSKFNQSSRAELSNSDVTASSASQAR
jgi:hypothetical protein